MEDSILVQKYGGTSLGSPERIRKVAQEIAKRWNQGSTPMAIVVSAMAGETNRLIDLVHQVNPKASAASYDLAISTGEQVSTALLSSALEGLGVFCEPLLAYQLGIFTDGSHAKARIHSIDTKRITDSWDRCRLPIIAGFQGVTKDLSITTLGRGGSDTSAVALAVALRASQCEIYTDVDGIYTADPRIVPQAKLLQKLDYETTLELASLGGKVLHSRCVELGAKYKVPITVLSSFDFENGRRTEIMNYTEAEALEAPVVSVVTLDRDVARVSLEGLPQQPFILSRIFNSIANAGINVDIIVQNRPENGTFKLGFTVSCSDLQKTVLSLEILLKESDFQGVQIKTADRLSKVSVVGLGMKSHPGVASRVFEALSQEDINVHMVSTSEIKISCVVDQGVAEKAVRLLHETFIESSD